MKNLTALSLKTAQGLLYVLDQTLLPQQQRWLACRTVAEMVAMIKALQLRGAPAIGIGACLLLAYRASVGDSRQQLLLDAEV
ncbi:MAG TPA: S-methyl-5-thioribose-1-phosphate isomerase, partial [Rheinheimera sp.]|nr:S-methyl-5-thioribose-1-phosphate isomerase [Rheinheimera sp.]